LQQVCLARHQFYGVLQTLLELLREKLVACLRALCRNARRLELVLVRHSLQPVVLDGRVERSLLVLQVEQVALFLQLRFVHGCLSLSVVEERYAHRYSAAQAEVVFHLRAPSVVAHRRSRGRNAGIEAYGRHSTRLSHLYAEVAALYAELCILYLRSLFERSRIHVVQRRHSLKRHVVCGRRYGDVKLLVACNLQQFLQLALVVAQVALGFNDGILVLRTLRRELRQVCLAHLAHLYHCLAALLVGLACFQTLLRHGDSLVRVEYLHVELRNLLEHVVGCGSRVESCLLGSHLVQLHVVAVLVAVPHRPVARERVRSVVVNLIHARLHVAVRHRSSALLRPRRVAYVLRCRQVERRQQRRLALLHVFEGGILLYLCFLQLDVVSQGVVDTVSQRPLLCRTFG